MKNSSTLNKALNSLQKASLALSAHVKEMNEGITESERIEIEKKLGLTNELLKNRRKFDSVDSVHDFLKKNNIG